MIVLETTGDISIIEKVSNHIETTLSDVEIKFIWIRKDGLQMRSEIYFKSDSG